MDWRQQIVELALVKQALRDADRAGLWEYRLPGVAATPEELEAVEEVIGEPLDPQYRDFLEHAGGWEAFWQSVDLFGPNDFISGRFKRAQSRLDDLEESVLTASGVTRIELIPIAESPVDLDLFVLTSRKAIEPGRVVWLAGTEIDRFPSFEEFFLAMMDYNRLELASLRGGAT